MKKKIAILATYVGEVNRGAETFVIELSKKLADKFDITVFSKKSADEIKNLIQTVNTKLPFWFSFHNAIYKNILLFRKICDKLYYLIPGEIEQYYFSKTVYKNFLLRGNYDLIFPNNGIWGAKFAEKLRRLKSTPFIYTGHGGNGIGELKIMKCNPDKYIALTGKNKKWAERYFPSVEKIHIGINKFKQIQKKPVNNNFENLEKPVILCVGAFNEMKRQLLLVKAFKLLDKGTLILLGKGENLEYIKSYCAENLKKKYFILDTGYDEIGYYYNLCDIFSLPSKDEPFGIVYLEAMVANKPVVATNDDTRKEIINNAGILCDVENQQEYATALKECFSRNWENIPRERAENLFGWDIIAGKYESLIKNLLGN